ncbi:hypothetical protein COX84_03530, partial [Candidatus Micrarchaeota archaeon CG_4_10_14_0_2_um_filter_49_7]
MKPAISHKKYDSMEVDYFFCGHDPDSTNKAIFWAFEGKSHQFNDNIKFPKVLIISCHYPGSFSWVDFIPNAGSDSIDYKLIPKACSAVFIDAGFVNLFIPNINAAYPLTEQEMQYIKER